jgi:hypothetical protein
MAYHDGHALRQLARRLFETMHPKADWFATPEALKREYERHVSYVIADRTALQVATGNDVGASARA